jgi:CBS-domain-containing membrane protein
MHSFLIKLRGDNTPLPAKPSGKNVALAWLGGFVAIAAVATLSDALSAVLILGSFGASCVLIFGYPDVPFSQPRNIVIGHVLSSLIGVTFLKLFGPTWWALALAAGTAIAAMMLTRTVHPPGG